MMESRGLIAFIKNIFKPLRKNDDITYEDIETILAHGMNAASVGNKQPWHFIVIKDEFKLMDMLDFHPYAKILKTALIAILICSDERREQDQNLWVQDCSAASQNILSKAKELGYGATWLGLYPREDRIVGMRRLFAIPPYAKPFSIISINSQGDIQKKRESFNEFLVHYEKW
jgi:nitroreductase